MIGSLKKLKGRSLRELVHRGRQKAAVIAERSGISPDTHGISDAEFLKLFGRGSLTDADSFFEDFRNRPHSFYPSFQNRQATVSALVEKFPDESESIVAAADRICEGRFDLLGFRDLDFGRPVPNWHLEPVSGVTGPLIHWSEFDETDPARTGDKKIIWELNRHQYFTVLGQAHWATGDEKYADVFVSHLEDWIEKNPPKMGVNWMSSLEIAFRSISWIWAFHFFRDSARFSSETFLRMAKVLYLNGRHITSHLSTYSSPNTHLTGESLGSYLIGSFLKGIPEAERWEATGRQALVDALSVQVREDGGYVEQSTQYQRYTADFYLSLTILESAQGRPVEPEIRKKIVKLLKFLAVVRGPDGRTPLIGDDDGGRLHFLDSSEFDDFCPTIAVAAALLREGGLKYMCGEPRPELVWLLGPDGLSDFDELPAVKPPAKAIGFEQSGVYVVRDDWSPESAFLLVDCGPHGFLNGGHAHADALSFVYSVNGLPIFVDPGTYNYTLDRVRRDEFRGTGVHNCLTVDGQSSSIMAGPFSWQSQAETRLLKWETTESGSTLRGTHNGFERLGVKYEREFEYLRGGQLTITDDVDSETVHHFEVRFTLHPTAQIEDISDSRVLIRPKGGNSTLLAVDTKLTGGEVQEVFGWRAEPTEFSPRYGALLPTVRILFEFSARGRVQACTSIMPSGVAK